ncbi:glycosyltransferase [candidate division WOR-3 bacterium]|nr:glycosyltransferase [candidate division WOR-3 bacterium]
MLSLIIYNLLLAVFFPFIAIVIFAKVLQTRHEWMERWGFMPKFRKRFVIWIHGSSVGEINSLRQIYTDLSAKHPRYRFLVTSYTRTGLLRAEEIMKGKNVKTAFFPFDFPLSIINAINRVRPSCILFTETEIWPNFLFLCRLKRIPVFLLSARISDKTYPRYKAFRRFLKRVLSSYTYVFAQDELNAKRFEQIGVPPDKILKTGSLKALYQKQSPPPLPLGKDTILWTAGPVREDEFQSIIEVYSRIKTRFPSLALLIAPRYLDLTSEIIKFSREKGIEARLRSKSTRIDAGLTVLDSLGELPRFYTEAKIAFVGGSLVNSGGHNPLEAAFQGVPVLMGPYYQNVEETMKKLAEAKGAWIIQDAKELEKALEKILTNEEMRMTASKNIRQAALSMLISKEEIYESIEKMIPGFSC